MINAFVSIVIMIFIAVLFTHAYIKVKSTEKGSHFIDKVVANFSRIVCPCSDSIESIWNSQEDC